MDERKEEKNKMKGRKEKNKNKIKKQIRQKKKENRERTVPRKEEHKLSLCEFKSFKTDPQTSNIYQLKHQLIS